MAGYGIRMAAAAAAGLARQHKKDDDDGGLRRLQQQCRLCAPHSTCCDWEQRERSAYRRETRA